MISDKTGFNTHTHTLTQGDKHIEKQSTDTPTQFGKPEKGEKESVWVRS